METKITHTNKFLLFALIVWASCFLMPLQSALGNEMRPGIQSLIKASLELDLNDEQEKQISELLKKRTERHNELQKKAQNSLKDYLQEALKTSTNHKTLEKKNKEAQALYQDLRAYQLETWYQIRGLLTDKQLNDLREKQEKALNPPKERSTVGLNRKQET